MAVYRVNKNRGYTVTANFHLRDKSLSLKAVGLLSKMLSFNDGWKFSTKGLSAICKEGPDAILSALRELEKHGYLVRHRQRDGKGRMSSTIFEIYEEPQESTPEREMPHTENPCVEKPDVDNPRGDKSAQINTDQVITQERNTLSKNYQSINLDGIDRMDERSEYEEIIKRILTTTFSVRIRSSIKTASGRSWTSCWMLSALPLGPSVSTARICRSKWSSPAFSN